MSSIILPIITLLRSKGLNEARSALMGASKDFGSFAQSIGRAASAFAGFQALTAATQFTVQSVELTNQFERNMLGLKQVFEEAAPAIEAFTKQVEDYGLSQSQAAQASVFLGSVLKQYGFSVTQSADQTKRLVTLAQDLATTYGYDVQEALLAITALFRGEYDPIEKFGVAMKQSEVNARLAADGLSDLQGAELANAQATARLTMLFERANDSVGAFTRASDTLYASQQRLSAIMQNVQVAFGTPLQRPLAKVNDLLADLTQEYGPQLVGISEAIAGSIEAATPLIVTFGETFFLVLAPLQQVIELLSGLIGLLSNISVPVANASNAILTLLVQALDTASSRVKRLSIDFDNFLNKIAKSDIDAIDRFFQMFDPLGEKNTDNYFRNLLEYLERLEQSNLDAIGAEQGANILEQIDRIWEAENAARNLGQSADDSATALTYMQTELQRLGIYSEDTEGKLSGLALLFSEIDEEARKSKASDSLLEIGFSAGQIAEILTRPDWEQIFGEISRLAKLTAIDIAKIPSVTAAAGIFNMQQDAKKALDALLKSIIGDSGAAGKDAVGEFYKGIKDEVAKQSARIRLEGLGASEGLIEQILGSSDWEKVYNNVIKSGIAGIRRLQAEFGRTSAGIKETAKDLADAQKIADDIAEEQRQINEDLISEFEDAQRAAEEFKTTLQDIANIRILPTIERDLGRFESQIVDTFETVRSSLRDALSSGVIGQDAFDTLLRFADQEAAVLESIARQRDELAERYRLSEALIAEYKSAFTAALNLSNLMGQLRNETETRVVTETISGVTRLRNSLRSFSLTITREYEETINSVTNRSEQLLVNFRTLAEKARAFAENLRRLKALGLDPMLFNQIVEAGVEAGGETAAALVEGGADAINEMNSIFRELGDLGGELGEDVARDLYGSGVAMGTGLLDGLRSMQQALENQAIAMARSFADVFAERVAAAVQAALEALPQPEDVETPGGGGGGGGGRFVAQVMSMPAPTGLPSLNPINAGMAFGGGVTNNYNINVKADPTQSPAQIAVATRDALISLSRTGSKVAL